MRALCGMSRRQLARQSGISERYVAQIEAGKGNVSIVLLRRIVYAIRCVWPRPANPGSRPDDLLAVSPESRSMSLCRLAQSSPFFRVSFTIAGRPSIFEAGRRSPGRSRSDAVSPNARFVRGDVHRIVSARASVDCAGSTGSRSMRYRGRTALVQAGAACIVPYTELRIAAYASLADPSRTGMCCTRASAATSSIRRNSTPGPVIKLTPNNPPSIGVQGQGRSASSGVRPKGEVRLSQSNELDASIYVLLRWRH